MKVKFTCEEWFPVYFPCFSSECQGTPFEVTPEQISKWANAIASFEEAQNEIKAVLKQAKAERERGKK